MLEQKVVGGPAATSRTKWNRLRKKSCFLWSLGIRDLQFHIKHLVSILLSVVCFSVTQWFPAMEKLSSGRHRSELRYCARTVPLSAPIVVMDIILRGIPQDCSKRTSRALGAVIHPSTPKPAYPLSNQTWTLPLSARQTCSMGIIVHCRGFHHCNPSTKCRHSSRKMKRAEGRVAYSPLQRAQEGKTVESVAWAKDSSALPPARKEQKIKPSCYPEW